MAKFLRNFNYVTSVADILFQMFSITLTLVFSKDAMGPAWSSCAKMMLVVDDISSVVFNCYRTRRENRGCSEVDVDFLDFLIGSINQWNLTCFCCAIFNACKVYGIQFVIEGFFVEHIILLLFVVEDLFVSITVLYNFVHIIYRRSTILRLFRVGRVSKILSSTITSFIFLLSMMTRHFYLSYKCLLHFFVTLKCGSNSLEIH